MYAKSIFMKLFRTTNIDIVSYCRTEFTLNYPAQSLNNVLVNLEIYYRSCDNLYCKLLCVCDAL